MESVQVASLIKKRIEQLGLVQKFVANKAGYSQNTFNAMVNGKRKISTEDLMRICEALDTDPNTLLGYTEQPQQNPAAVRG